MTAVRLVPHKALRTPFCEMTGIDYPVVQTGMGWVADARLTAATSSAGGLGIVGASTMNLTEMTAAIDQVLSLTDLPFGVNLRSDAPDVYERAKVMIDRGVKVASFALAPTEKLIKSFKDAGLLCVPSIGARRHAEKVVGWGADAVIVQGSEAGGHTGGVATSILIPQVIEAINVPVIAAGGFRDGRGLVAALAYGAQGVAMGTRFLVTKESPVPDQVKQVYLEARPEDTVLTDRIDGHSHRVLRTPFIDRMIAGGGGVRDLLLAMSSAVNLKRTTGMSLIDMVRQALAARRQHNYNLRQAVMAANTPMLLRKTMVDGEVEHGIISGGQVSGLITDAPSVEELILSVIREANMTLESLQA